MLTQVKQTETFFETFENLVLKIISEPKSERYNLSLEYVTEEGLNEALNIGKLLNHIGSGVNILINAFTSNMVLDFLTSHLNENNYTLYISDRF